MKRLSNKHCLLPNDFATKILDLELKIQHNCKLDDINTLVTLYSSAIEFYESIHDDSYLSYQARLHETLTRKEVLAVLNPKPKPAPRSSQLTHSSSSNRLSDQRKVENTLKVFTDRSNYTGIRAQDNLKRQEDSFEKKRMERKSSKSRPGSREGSLERPIDTFEAALEKILEKFVNERIRRSEVLDKKYNLMVKGLDEQNENCTGMSLKEIEGLRMKEKQVLGEKLDIERKMEINRLKSVYSG